MGFLAALLVLGALSSGQARGLPRFSTPVDARAVKAASYDYVIVGGGISGLTIADRLTQDPKVTVLVIEAGPFDKGEDGIQVPGSWNPVPYFWPGLETETLTALNNRKQNVICAKVVGGGSTINAMNLLRATRADYNGWVSLGNEGWGWNDMLPFFKKVENFTAPDASFAARNNISWNDAYRGRGGPVQYSYPNYAYPGQGNWWSAALSTGMKRTNDPAEGINPGLFWIPTVLDKRTQTRCSARIAHYDRVSSRPNYHVLVESKVSRVLFDGTRAIGVEYIEGTGSKATVRAFKEVLLAAGALHTPQILQLSGVGDRKVLKSLGIRVVSDLPGVGANFQDHAAVDVQYNFTNLISPNAGSLQTNATFNAEQRALYDNHEPSAFTVVARLGTTFGALAFHDISPARSSILPDAARRGLSSLPAGTDATVAAGYAAQRKILLEQYKNKDMAVGVMAWDSFSSVTVSHVNPFSRGKITIKSTDVSIEPIIDYRTASDETDLHVIAALLQKLRQVMAAPDMAALGTMEASPLGARVKTNDQVVEVLRSSLGVSAAHQCCSAAMMPKRLGGVVDSTGRVYGVSSLRVVDVSTFPMAVSGGPAANVYGTAEKFADMIKRGCKASTGRKGC